MSWYQTTLEEIILEYRNGEDEEPLDGDEVDRLVEILRAKINLHEGNITNAEYDKIMEKSYKKSINK